MTYDAKLYKIFDSISTRYELHDTMNERILHLFCNQILLTYNEWQKKINVIANITNFPFYSFCYYYFFNLFAPSTTGTLSSRLAKSFHIDKARLQLQIERLDYLGNLITPHEIFILL